MFDLSSVWGCAPYGAYPSKVNFIYVSKCYCDVNGDYMNIKGFIKNCGRVLKVTRKPTKDEYFTSAKITGLGIILIGGIGFLVFLIFHLLGLFG